MHAISRSVIFSLLMGLLVERHWLLTNAAVKIVFNCVNASDWH
jgi:hypothetical protein